MATKKNKRGSSALDPLMAGFAGGAAAFIIYAMPQPRFDDVVALSGLPAILSAAQPPLGTTARVAVMIAAGLAAFVIVWFILRALGKPGARAKRRAELEELEMAPPRLRRADMHPDAPSRRPILAGVDLGRPFDDLPTDRDPGDEAPIQDEAEIEAEDGDLLAEGQPLYAPSAYGGEPAEELADHTGYDEDEDREASSFDEPAEDDIPEAEVEEAEYERVIVHQQVDEEPEEQPFELSPLQAQSVDALSQRLPSARDPKVGISELMDRLEAGLNRRRPNRWTQPSGERSNGSAAGHSGDPLDSRLRGAVEELQRIASRGN
jgi:hypothetical protein